jgi:hypothetical protein
MSTTKTRTRGDTLADRFTVTDSNGAPVNITSWAFALTLNSEKDPVDATNQIVSLAGVITNAAAGEVEFPWDDLEADQPPGTYYYDIQYVTDTGEKYTPVKGTYKFTQDINKG